MGKCILSIEAMSQFSLFFAKNGSNGSVFMAFKRLHLRRYL